MEKKLEQLLLEKKFHQLTAEEKYYVTEYLEETEYDRMHLFLKNSKTNLNNLPTINPELKGKLMAAFRQQHGIKGKEKTAAIIQLMRHRAPVWQMAAAIALMIGLHFWLREEPIVVGKTETVYVHHTDTIYKESPSKVIQAEQLVESQHRINRKPKLSQPFVDSTKDEIAADPNLSEIGQPSDTFAMQVSQPHGQSAAQTSELWELLGEVY